MINWKIRIKNKMFWMAFIPMILLLAKQIGNLIGIDLEIEGLSDQLVAIVETVFVILGLVGVAVDPTTDGLSDSYLAMTYEEPKRDIEIE